MFEEGPSRSSNLLARFGPGRVRLPAGPKEPRSCDLRRGHAPAGWCPLRGHFRKQGGPERCGAPRAEAPNFGVGICRVFRFRGSLVLCFVWASVSRAGLTCRRPGPLRGPLVLYSVWTSVPTFGADVPSPRLRLQTPVAPLSVGLRRQAGLGHSRLSRGLRRWPLAGIDMAHSAVGPAPFRRPGAAGFRNIFGPFSGVPRGRRGPWYTGSRATPLG